MVIYVAIDTKYIHVNHAVNLLQANTSRPSITLTFTIHDPLETIFKSIMNHDPDAVGFSVYMWNVEAVLTLTKWLKGRGKLVILGGPEVSYDATHFLTVSDADVIVKGEAEAVINKVLDYLIDKTPLGAYGVAYKKGTKIIDGTTACVENLATIKQPVFTKTMQREAAHQVHYIEASRGCPYQCSFCLSSLEKGVRFFPVETITNTMDTLIENGAKTIKFLDRTFNANPKTLAIIKHIIDHYHLHDAVFQFEITGETLDPAIIAFIHKHAPKELFRFEIGIQSTHPLTNKLTQRAPTSNALLNTIKTIIDTNIIDVHLDLIAGLPKEDLTRFKESFNTVAALKPPELQLGFLKMLRGTKIRNEANRFKYRFNPSPPYEIIENDVLTKDDIARIKSVEIVLNRFHNRGLFGQHVLDAAVDYGNPFDFFEKLSETLKNQGISTLRYQLKTLYSVFEQFLAELNMLESRCDALRYTYLTRAKTKPPPYFPLIKDKTVKYQVYKAMHARYGVSVDTLFKHAILTKRQDGSLLAVLYQNHQAVPYRL